MRVAVYMRMARDEGTEQAFANQEQMLRVFAEQHQMEIAGIFRDVGSGLNFERPGLKELLSELSASRYDGVLTRYISRIGRDVAPALKVIEEIEKKGAKVICMNGDHQNLDSTKGYLQSLEQRLRNHRKRR